MPFHELLVPKWKLLVVCVYLCFEVDHNLFHFWHKSFPRKQKHLFILIDPVLKSSWDLFVGQKHFNNACDYGASWKHRSGSFFSKETVFIFKNKLPYLIFQGQILWKSNLSLPSMDLFNWAPKLQLKANSLLHGTHNSFLILTVMPFTRRVHVYCRVQVRRKKNKKTHPIQKTTSCQIKSTK